ncbi:DUF4440 domain-containing protein [Phycisphaerales bacterium AB-hyl4]|uniref:DUF4440 domain-containing protein n=1 Tax=Natronomicrosphaera hydrolytica TaxID=3242702 RepID=A0ABV4U3I6_9BACT
MPGRRLNIPAPEAMILFVDIAPPPLWEHLLLERPWPLVVALLVGAILIRYVARQRRQPVMGHVALGLAIAAGGVLALAWTVTTDRQLLERHTRQLVAATESPGDFSVIDRLLAPDAVLTGPDGDVWMNLSAIRNQLEQAIDRYTIDDQIIRDIGAEVTGDNRARSAFDLRTYSGAQAGLPTRSTWTLHWRRGDDGEWRITRVQWDSFMDRPPSRSLW